jgi:hypothetical protein
MAMWEKLIDLALERRQRLRRQASGTLTIYVICEIGIRLP